VESDQRLLVRLAPVALQRPMPEDVGQHRDGLRRLL
jgi:hypothetical protein